MINNKMVNNKKSKVKKEKVKVVYRTKQERKEEVNNIINKLTELQLSTEYEAIKKLYKTMFEYINNGDRIIINIPFPEINKRIEGILPINKLEQGTLRLKHEKF